MPNELQSLDNRDNQRHRLDWRNGLIHTLIAVLASAVLLVLVSSFIMKLPDQPRRPFLTKAFSNMANSNDNTVDQIIRQTFESAGSSVSDAGIMLYESVDDGLFRRWCPARQDGIWCLRQDTEYIAVIPIKQALGNPSAQHDCAITIIYSSQLTGKEPGTLSILGSDIDGKVTTLGFFSYRAATDDGFHLQHAPLFSADEPRHEVAIDENGLLYISFYASSQADVGRDYTEWYVETDFGKIMLGIATLEDPGAPFDDFSDFEDSGIDFSTI